MKLNLMRSTYFNFIQLLRSCCALAAHTLRISYGVIQISIPLGLKIDIHTKGHRTSKNYLFLFLIGLFFLPSCKTKTAVTPLFELKESTGIDFLNSVSHSKDFNLLTYRNFYNGGGVAIGDVNNDGLADVFFTANMGSNKLYKNKGNWQFEDISEKTGFVEKQD